MRTIQIKNSRLICSRKRFVYNHTSKAAISVAYIATVSFFIVLTVIKLFSTRLGPQELGNGIKNALFVVFCLLSVWLIMLRYCWTQNFGPRGNKPLYTSKILLNLIFNKHYRSKFEAKYRPKHARNVHTLLNVVLMKSYQKSATLVNFT